MKTIFKTELSFWIGMYVIWATKAKLAILAQKGQLRNRIEISVYLIVTYVYTYAHECTVNMCTACTIYKLDVMEKYFPQRYSHIMGIMTIYRVWIIYQL